MNEPYDLFVIGAGSAGVRAARMASQYGVRVGVAESRDLGGTCVNLGCIPKKIFSYAAHFHHDFLDARRYGWSAEVPAFDWKTLVTNKNQEIARLNGIYQGLLERNGVELHRGRARVTGPNEVEVNGARYEAKHIVVAVGGRPYRPDGLGVEHTITSDEAFHLDALPKRVLVVGGGYIAVEFAGIFNALGVETTLIHRGEHVLRGFDIDIRRRLTAAMAEQGIDMRMGQTCDVTEKRGEVFYSTTSTNDVIETDLVMLAVGRTPSTAGLGLEGVGVELDARGAVKVDEYFKTTADSVYALGDVIDRVTLTPVAIYEAMALARTLFTDQPQAVDYEAIPSAVFSAPPVGACGLNEEQARATYAPIDVYESDFRPLKHVVGGRNSRSYMKVIVHRATDRVLGMHMLGDDAPEIMQGFAAAMKVGVTKSQLDRTVGIHPTAAEEFVTMRTPRR